MISLFRRIRQKLIDSGSVTKYLFYAIGEILLVVIGILIALQVNNWNEERKDRIEEKYYLEKLIENIEADSTLLADQTDYLVAMTSRIDSALGMMLDESTFESDRFTILINDLLGVPVFVQNSVTYENLISSGKISLITDQSLVNSLFEYYNPGNEYLNWNDAATHYTRNVFGPFLLEVDHLVESGLNRGTLNENYSRLQKPLHTYSYYRENQRLLNYLNMKYRINTGQLNVYEENVFPLLNETLRLLRESLNDAE